MEQAHPLHIDRLASLYPKLKIVIAHMGNPWLVDTIGVMWRNPHVYTDLSGFFNEFHSLDPHEVASFHKRMADVEGMLGSFKRCLFGTDWPLYSQREYLEAVQKLPMDETEKELVYWKNTQHVFNLTLE